VGYKQLITGNRMGVLKSFDVKAGGKPFQISCEDGKRCNSVTSICYHPTQKHILLGGSDHCVGIAVTRRKPKEASVQLVISKNSRKQDSIRLIQWHLIL
jgi:hypothetical protein